jgi:heme oxygenase
MRSLVRGAVPLGGPAGRAGLSALLRSTTRSAHEQVERVFGLPDRLHTRTDLLPMLRVWQSVWTELAAEPVGGRDADAATVCAARGLQELAQQSLSCLEADLADLAALEGAGPVSRPHRQSRPNSSRADVLSRGTVGAAATADVAAGLPPVPVTEVLAAQGGIWGVSYVVRGSLLNGRVLAPMIASRLGVQQDRGLRYLSGCGDDPGRRWVTFRAELDDWGQAATKDQHDGAIAAARATLADIRRRATAHFEELRA